LTNIGASLILAPGGQLRSRQASPSSRSGHLTELAVGEFEYVSGSDGLGSQFHGEIAQNHGRSFLVSSIERSVGQRRSPLGALDGVHCQAASVAISVNGAPDPSVIPTFTMGNSSGLADCRRFRGQG
jgi:hypothetical protein